MRVLKICLVFVTLIGLCCTNSKGQNISTKDSRKDSSRIYSEIWGFTKNGEKGINNEYEGLWRVYRTGSDFDVISNYSIFDLIFPIGNNKYFVCSFIDYNKKSTGYQWIVSFAVLEEIAEIIEYEQHGKGLTDVDTTIPKNYMKNFAPIIIRYDDLILKSYYKEFCDESSFDYKEYSESLQLLPQHDTNNAANKYFNKQNPDSSMDQYITVDPMEGLWYLTVDDAPASEEAFMETSAILIIGKDEKRNPGWYHVVLYYDSGDKGKGWICEWGAAEINDKELYVQLSSMSEGKPFSIVLNEKNGKRWLSVKHSTEQIKTGQFIRMLPLR